MSSARPVAPDRARLRAGSLKRGRGTRRALIAVAVAVSAVACGTPAGGETASPSVGSSAAATPRAVGTTGDPGTSASPSASVSPSSRAGPPAAAAWSRLDVAQAPPAREDHTWTLAPETGAAWLFGGRDGSRVFDDVWRFDLATERWDHVAVSGAGPAARFGHTATWVPAVGIVVWSGQAGSTFFDDAWAFDPSTGAWRELTAGGPRPPARYGSCAALGPDGRLWVSHGFTADSGRFADTWAYDFASGRWTDVTPAGGRPVERCLHDCLWTEDGRLVLYAGQTTGVAAIADLWTLTPAGTWTAAPTPEPTARQLYAVASDGRAAWIFGGGGADRSKLADLWYLELGPLRWHEVPPRAEGPTGRSGAALILGDDGRLVLFGGVTDDGPTAETWVVSPAS